jgi:acetylornithine deacetylase/succinyl-diaminopimelate desuccinylase-like protein
MTDLATRVEAALDATYPDYLKFISIPSVSSQPEHDPDLVASAETYAGWLCDMGCPDVQVVREGGAPAVLAHFPAPAGKPTICLYAHHDEQPTGDLSLWTTPPFEPQERGGRLWGRGAADDKGCAMSHIAMLRAFDGKPPVGIKLFIEGEEEYGSTSLGAIIERHRDMLEADLFIIADGGTWEVGVPAVTTTLRGVVSAVVTVETLKTGVHSGEFGGVVPDALTTLCRLLATLHDEKGDVAIEGLLQTPAPDLDYPEERLVAETGKLDGVEFIGSGTFVERMWTRPTASVLAIDTTSVANASNTLIPKATAKVSVRIAPGEDAPHALACLVNHLQTHASWGAHVSIGETDAGQPGIAPFEGPLCQVYAEALTQAFGVAPDESGPGGSIPMIAEFMDAFPNAEIACTGVADPDAHMHGIDESVELADWRKYTMANALFLEKLGK